jgi:hypothetical protein
MLYDMMPENRHHLDMTPVFYRITATIRNKKVLVQGIFGVVVRPLAWHMTSITAGTTN